MRARGLAQMLRGRRWGRRAHGGERDAEVRHGRRATCRPSAARRSGAEDFHEIYREFAAEKAAEQAGRCSQCGVPYCQTHCPLHNNIPDWLKLTAEGRLREAYELSQATNTFPEICGRICPQDRLCEGNCVIEQSGHGTVTIGAVEKYITDTAWEEGWVQPLAPGAERPESVGIIGAGPGGLAAADMLRRQGLQVTVYDRYDRAGGLLTYGIPGFKLEKEVVLRRNVQLAAGGVDVPAELQRRRGHRLRRDPRAARRGADRHRRLQVARPRRAGRGAGRHRAGDRLPDRLEPQGLRRRGAGLRQRRAERRRASGWWWSAAATRRWTACAPRCGRARPR